MNKNPNGCGAQILGFLVFAGVVILYALPYFITQNGFITFLVDFGITVVAILVFVLYRKSSLFKGKKEKAAQKAQAEKEEMEAHFSFNITNSTLYLKKRGPEIRKYIEIQDAYNLNFKYKPETLHIGAVSVGGVVSGGTYTTGGYHYLDSMKKNGLCYLVFGENHITTIQLTDELYKKAENTEIQPFLDSEKKQIIVRVHERSSLEELRIAHQNILATGVSNELANKGQPTLEKAAKILNWMATES